MINIQTNFRAISIPVRHHLTDCPQHFIERIITNVFSFLNKIVHRKIGNSGNKSNILN